MGPQALAVDAMTDANGWGLAKASGTLVCQGVPGRQPIR